jgi:uncharacterized membrane protein YgcG
MQRWDVRRGAARGLVLVALGLLLLPASSAGATVSPLGQPPQIWSAGGQGSGNWSYPSSEANFSGVASWSWNETITATNTSTNVTQLESEFVATYTSTSTFCYPNCTAPTYLTNYTTAVGTARTAFLNLTTNASVYENGSASPALGALNASVAVVRTIGSSFTCQAHMVRWWWGCGWGNGSSSNRSFATSVNGSELSTASVAFTPALGLIPWNATANLTWNSTSAFVAAGGWNDSFYFQSNSSSGAARSAWWNWSGAVNRSGNEAAHGRDLGNVTGPNNSTVQGIRLCVGGRFDFASDLFPTVIGSDLFNNATANWTVAHGFGGDAVAGIFLHVLREHESLGPSSSGASGGGGSTTGSGAGSGTGGGSPGGGASTSAPAPSLPSPPGHASRNVPVVALPTLAPSPTGRPALAWLPWAVLGVAVAAIAAGIGLARSIRRAR